MKFKKLSLIICSFSFISAPIWADDSANNAAAKAKQEQIIHTLTHRTAALEAELKELQQQIRELKGEKRKVQANVAPKANAQLSPQQQKNQPEIGDVLDVPEESSISVARSSSENQANKQKPSTSTPTKPGLVGEQVPIDATFEEESAISTEESRTFPLYFLSKHPLFLGGTPVIVSPYLGLRSETDVFDLIVNLPSVNEDLRILKQKQEIADAYRKHNLPIPDVPLLNLSGKVEGQITAARLYTDQHSTNVNLTGAELDIAGMINRWSTLLLAIVYDSAPPAVGTVVDNSRLFLDKGFLTLGNLDRSPFYATLGQFYVPFGQYSTLMISDPLTKLVGRIKARALLLGYDQDFGIHRVNASLFGFRGYANNTINVTQYGANLDYLIREEKWKGNLAASYVANIGDANTFQQNGGPSGFTGFSNTSESLIHRVPGFDARGSFSMGPFDIFAEYVTATDSFSAINLTYNAPGAKPSAFHIEGVYNFKILDKNSLISVGYDMTSEALALLLPERRYIATFSISLLENTIQSLEYRHDINYGTSDFATGQGLPVVPTGLGHTSDTVTFQVGFYF